MHINTGGCRYYYYIKCLISKVAKKLTLLTSRDMDELVTELNDTTAEQEGNCKNKHKIHDGKVVRINSINQSSYDSSQRLQEAVLHSAVIGLISENLFIAHSPPLIYCIISSTCLKGFFFASPALLSHPITGILKKHSSDPCTLNCCQCRN